MFDFCIVHECALCMSFRRCDASTYDVEEIWEAVALHYFGLTIVCLMGGKDMGMGVLMGQVSAQSSFGKLLW